MIQELRDTLAADLAVLDIPIYAAWPAKITPPCVFVTPPVSAPYVTAGPNFSEYTVAVDVVALVAKADAAVALANLEVVIEAVLANSVDWGLSGVDSPSTVAVNGVDYLGTVLHLNKPSRLTT